MISVTKARLVTLSLIAVLIIGIVAPVTARADTGWYGSNWQYRKQITINSANVSGSTNLLNFPVLISLTSDSDLGGKAQLDGDDIFFTDDASNKLSHELESYSSNGATANLTAWVRIASLSPSVDTDIFMYYGNSSATNQEDAMGVWDSYYMIVQHMEESSGGANAITDSTLNANNGTDNSTLAFGATGQINGSIGFDAASYDSIDFGTDSTLKMTDAITIELWVNRTNTTSFERFLSHSQGDNTYAYELGVDATETGKWRFRLNNDAVTLKVAMVGGAGQWLYLVATYNKDAGGTDEMKMYEDANLIGTQDYSTAIANHGTLETNRIGKNDGWLNSVVDEVRISNIARDAYWINTSYNNQSNPAAFYTLGAEQPQITIPTVIGGLVMPVNKAVVLAPWIALTAVLLLAVFRLVWYLKGKRKSTYNPTTPYR